MPRLTITPEDFKRSKLVKNGWYVTLVKDAVEKLSSKKDSNNIEVDCENADRDAGYIGVTCKHWFSEKGTFYPGGVAAFARAFNPDINEEQIQDIEFDDYKGRYIYAKWITFRGKDGQDPPQNRIEDWAPLPKKYSDLANAVVEPSTVGFAKV